MPCLKIPFHLQQPPSLLSGTYLGTSNQHVSDFFSALSKAQTASTPCRQQSCHSFGPVQLQPSIHWLPCLNAPPAASHEIQSQHQQRASAKASHATARH